MISRVIAVALLAFGYCAASPIPGGSCNNGGDTVAEIVALGAAGCSNPNDNTFLIKNVQFSSDIFTGSEIVFILRAVPGLTVELLNIPNVRVTGYLLLSFEYQSPVAQFSRFVEGFKGGRFGETSIQSAGQDFAVPSDESYFRVDPGIVLGTGSDSFGYSVTDVAVMQMRAVYDPVPEPKSLLLITLGLAICAAFRSLAKRGSQDEV